MPTSGGTHSSPLSHTSPSQDSLPGFGRGRKRVSAPLSAFITSAAFGLSTPVRYQNVLSWWNAS